MAKLCLQNGKFKLQTKFFFKVFITFFFRFGNGNVIIGFKSGYIVCVSTEKSSDLNQELFTVQEFKNNLASFQINIVFGRLFLLGDNL